MPWYYANAGQQMGPIEDSELDRLIREGVIGASTLVWREGMANWQPLAKVRTDLPSPPPISPGATPIPLGPGQVICSECRKVFSAGETVQIGTATVCAACKPIYIQKLREGAVTFNAAASPLRYAGFWIRFVAKFIDGLIVGIPTMIIYLVVAMMTGVNAGMGGTPDPTTMLASMGLQVLAQLSGIVIGGIYNVYFVTRHAATPGKMAVGLRVIAADGQQIKLGRAIGRYFAEMVSGLICYIGYIMAGIDEEKRSLHDRMCNTRVVYK